MNVGRSEELDLDRYDTDKPAVYFKQYDEFLAPLSDKEIKLLELGVHRGGSLLLWRDYFPKGTIVGIDINSPEITDFGERIRFFRGDQTDTGFLTEVSRVVAPEGFDVIIDDASHIADLTRISFWHLFENHLKPGGLFVIEDWGTGYFGDWPDGETFDPPHNHGMVGLVKELVDEVGATAISKGRLMGAPTRRSRFEGVGIFPGIVFVRKRTYVGDRRSCFMNGTRRP